jgi:carboxynorspermidine decarboxylase
MNYIPSPCFVIDEALLRKNLELIKKVQDEAEIEIILAFKGFAMWGVFPIIREYITGFAASSLYEAKLGFEEMKSKGQTYCVAFRSQEFDEIIKYSSHITFNSLNQFYKYSKKAIAAGISCGIRVNPEYSEVQTELYNPTAPNSRLGMTTMHFGDKLPEGIEGLHFHALCENDSFALEHTLMSFEKKFGHLIPQAKWVNMGGGHLMTSKEYDIDHLIRLLKNFKNKYKVEVILEPGAAFVWQTGYLISTVLDIVENGGIKTAILDVSFTAHMPDCLEMPYRPVISGATEPAQGKSTYRIGGLSCLSGDYMSEYSFDQELKEGDLIIFEDMIQYTMVKTTMFNGIHHPDICILSQNNEFRLLKKFGYEDYKGRLS